MSAALTEERSNNPFSRFCHKATIDHHDIDSQESDLILADILSQELVTLECLSRAEPPENVFATRKIAPKMSSLNLLQHVIEHHCWTEVVHNHLSAAIQKPASDTSPL